MQRWTLDATSLASFALVVAATAALPAPVHLALLASELLFAASAAVRYSSFDASVSPFPGAPTRAARQPSLLRVLPWASQLLHRANPFSSSAAHASHHHGDDGNAEQQRHDECGGSHAESAAAKFFDEKEGHLGLLEGGHLMAQWFAGLAGPHQLRASHVSQLLSYLLLLPNQQPPAVKAATASTDDEDVEHAEQSQCPKIRAWVVRLMDILHPHAPSSSDSDSSSSPAFSGDAKLFACASEPITASYRPLVFYLLMEAVAGATHIALRVMGFRATATPNGYAQVYVWLPPAAPTSATKTDANTAVNSTGTTKSKKEKAAPAAATEETEPLVFLHGIGLGLTPYLRLLWRLVAASYGRRPVYAVQYKHVSMRLTSRIPAPHEVAADLGAYLVRKGVTRASVLAHSYGTLVASALNKLAATPAGAAAAPAITRLTLVDPVCFAMFLPHLVRNAIYQTPVEGPADDAAAAAATAAARNVAGGGSQGLLRQLLKGLVVAEFHCSVALRRRLNWAAVNMWPSELPENSTVVLSGRDNLVPVAEVRQILANRANMVGAAGSPQPTVLFHESLGHGGFLVNPDWQAEVLGAALGIKADEVNARVAAATAAAAAAAAANTTGAEKRRRQPRTTARAAPILKSSTAAAVIPVTITSAANVVDTVTVNFSVGSGAASSPAVVGPRLPRLPRHRPPPSLYQDLREAAAAAAAASIAASYATAASAHHDPPALASTSRSNSRRSDEAVHTARLGVERRFISSFLRRKVPTPSAAASRSLIQRLM